MSAIHTSMRLLLILFLTVILQSCLVKSLNPFYTQASVVKIQEFEGSWFILDDQGKARTQSPWIFSEGEILTFDEKGRGGPFTYKVFKLGDEIFLDVIPSSNSRLDASEFWTMSIWPLHSLLKITIADDQLSLIPLNYRWFEEKKKLGELSLPMIIPSDEDWGFLNVTAQEWAAFYLKNKDEKNLFGDDIKIILKRKKI